MSLRGHVKRHAMISAQDHHVSDGLARIIDLEARLDRELPPVRLVGRLPQSQMHAAADWSDAVWREALSRGPAALPRDIEVHARAVAERPVFICGVHRSGTTLVRDLLDDHPELAVLPSEGNYFTNFSRQVEALDREVKRERLGLIWLRRLANPINQPPYWLLGRSTRDQSQYVEFARAFMAFWDLLEAALGRRASSWPTAAVVLAFAYTKGQGEFDPSLSRWAEKTPTNERYLKTLWREFPDAQVIHVIRDPLSVVASRKLLEERANRAFTNLRAVLRDLTRSYRIARDQLRRGDHSRYLLLRYEDITLDPDATADRLAAFLKIERLAGLSRPTVAGEPSPANTSYAPASVRGQIAAAHDRSIATLTPQERDTVIAVTLRDAAAAGYRLPALAPWQQLMSRLRYVARL